MTTRKHTRGRPTVGKIGSGKANSVVEVPLRGRRTRKSAENSLQFFARIEGVEVDGHVRGANGIRWQVV